MEFKSLDDDEKEIITLKCKDGDVSVYKDYITKYSKMIESLLDCDKTIKSINLFYLEKKWTLKVVKYIEYHYKNNIKTIIQKPLHLTNCYADNINNNWDIEFITTQNSKDLKKIIHIANYLCIDDLLHLACSKLAFNLRIMSEDEIIENNFLDSDSLTYIKKKASWTSI
jgi:hypothetical protein